MTKTIIAAIGAETGLMGFTDVDGKDHLPWRPGGFREDTP